MSIIATYFDRSKAVIVSDDRQCVEDPATLQKRRIEAYVVAAE